MHTKQNWSEQEQFGQNRSLNKISEEQEEF